MTGHLTLSPEASKLSARPITRQRRQALARVFPLHTEMLSQSRAADVPRGDLEDYLALGWMRWAGARVVITPMGMGVRDILVAGGHEQRDDPGRGGGAQLPLVPTRATAPHR